MMDIWTDRQTDTISESSYGNMSAHKKIQFNAQNIKSQLPIDVYVSPDNGNA